MSELPGPSPPGPPPGLCPGPAGGLTAPPRPPAVCSNDLRSLQVAPAAQHPTQFLEIIE